MRLMQTLFDIFKGIIIGMANVIPGVSGGTLAISMGIYDILIDAVSDFLTIPLNSIKMVWKYVVGMAIGVLLAIFFVSYLFETVPIISSMLFVGLIAGAIPENMGKLVKDKIYIKDWITIFTVIAIVITLGLIDVDTSYVNANLTHNIFVLFMIGIILAITVVVPGISGSAILMALGIYTSIMESVKDTLECLFSFNIMQALDTGKYLIVIAIGMVIGIILTAKGIKKLVSKYPNTVYWGIVSLMSSTPILVIIQLDYTNITAVEIIFSILMLIIGCTLATNLSKRERK